jgi:hypothetical protein
MSLTRLFRDEGNLYEMWSSFDSEEMKKKVEEEYFWKIRHLFWISWEEVRIGVPFDVLQGVLQEE